MLQSLTNWVKKANYAQRATAGAAVGATAGAGSWALGDDNASFWKRVTAGAAVGAAAASGGHMAYESGFFNVAKSGSKGGAKSGSNQVKSNGSVKQIEKNDRYIDMAEEIRAGGGGSGKTSGFRNATMESNGPVQELAIMPTTATRSRAGRRDLGVRSSQSGGFIYD